jgi:hypothetical protein
MSKHAKTTRLIEAAKEVLAESRPMTVRQVYYQLVSRQVVKNCRAAYQTVSNALVTARQEGIIGWDWIEDRLRRPREVSMWSGLPSFADTCQRAYRRDVWKTQPYYFEVWLEKDALSGIFENVLQDYGVTLNVGRGYDGWSSIYNAAERFERYDDKEDVAILYFGDFDPSGDDMARSLSDRLAFFDCEPELTKCALIAADIERYKLPPNLVKSTDTRARGFIDKYGNVSVELDALPVDVLRERLIEEVEKRMNLDALAEVKEIENQERAKIIKALSGMGKG